MLRASHELKKMNTHHLVDHKTRVPFMNKLFKKSNHTKYLTTQREGGDKSQDPSSSKNFLLMPKPEQSLISDRLSSSELDNALFDKDPAALDDYNEGKRRKAVPPNQ